MSATDRPTPEQMLARIHAQGDGNSVESKRGRLKVFFGYAPGVGKTYAMLQEAHRLKSEGVDVVVGYVEPHGRPETESLLEGLEQLPTLPLGQLRATVNEFDLDGALARCPAVILVDELAHTNAPSQRHVKRWQDIEELLDAGIDVLTTCNVQHVESLNDVIARISGVTVRETVPDEVFNRADELSLIDVSPEGLLDRLRQGKVYIPAQAERALRHFFRRENLVALRELALRRTAERVHADVETARQGRAVRDVWATRERLLVCVSPSPTSPKVIRAAKRLADALGAEWSAVNVETPRTLHMPTEDRDRLLAHLRLAERLGAEAVTITGEDFVSAIVAEAQQRNVTKIVIGKSDSPQRSFRRAESLVDHLIRDSGNIDVYVIRGVADDEHHSPAAINKPFRLWPWIGTSIVLAVCTAIAWFFEVVGLTEANQVMTYLLGVVFVAYRYGRWPSIAASVLSVLLFDILLVEPYFTIAVYESQYLWTFGVMLFVGLAISSLTARIRSQAELSRRSERRTAALYRLGRNLSGINGQDFIAAETERAISEMFSGEAAVLLPRSGRIRPIVDHRARFAASEAEATVAQWVLDHGQIAGRGTDTLPAAQAVYFPLATPNGTMGVLGVRTDDTQQLLLPESRQLLETYAAQVALALERDRLTMESEESRVKAETEQLRSTLLSSVSHDLRTPLAVISGSASSLLHDASSNDSSLRREMLETIFDESDRLSRLVENLLRLTQLSSGRFAIAKDWHPLEDVIGSALVRLERALADRNINIDLPGEVLWGQFDGVLVEQVLVNLIENACRYTPANTPIDIRAYRDGHATVIEVSDCGPGLTAGEETAIFETFQRGAEARADSRGVGLGLAICRAVADAHGGRISAANRSGGGATFRLELPTDESPPRCDLAESKHRESADD